ncbi:hypothetical protein KQH82_04865 [bacterium]|nr:hypothetical protein [bacterium]
MRGVLFAFLVFCISLVCITDLYAQSDDDTVRQLLTAQPTTDCADYDYNARLILPGLFERRELDSIDAIIQFVEDNCNPSTFWKLRDLMTIYRGEFGDGLKGYDVYMTVVLDDFDYDVSEAYYVETNSSVDQHLQSMLGYGQFIDSLALALEDNYDSTTAEHYMLRFIRGDYGFIRRHLRAGDCPDRELQLRYDDEVERLLERSEDGLRPHLGALMGVWIPFDADNVLGPKMTLGFRGGFSYRRWELNAAMIFKFLQARRDYITKEDGYVDTSRSFFGGYIGLDGSYRLTRRDRHSFRLLGGIGFDGFDHNSRNPDRDATVVNSLNLNIGGEYRIAYGRSREFYFGLLGRYNFVNYATGGGSDLSGNTVSINLTWGWRGPNWAGKQLARIGYFD